MTASALVCFATLVWGSSTLSPASSPDVPFSAEKPPPKPELDIDRLLLSLPGSFAELAFVPVVALLNTLEHYHVFEKAFELFTNEKRTFAGLPIVEPFSRSGIGFGTLLAWNEPLGGPDRAIFFGLGRINGDRQVSLSIGRRVPPLSGRVLEFRASYSVDKDLNWFGLGSDQGSRAQRLVRMDEVSSAVGLSELFPQVINLDAAFFGGFRSRGLFSGTGSQAPSFVPGITDIRAPPGFGRTINYAEGNVRFRYDTRDGLGRTTRGLVWTIEGDASIEVSNPADSVRSGGLRGTSRFTWFLPVLPRHRVLVLLAGVSSAAPVTRGGEVALHQLVNLGGPNTLRGYQPDRFIDRLGWWSSLEYRFLLSDYGGSLIGFSGTLFADVGRVANSGTELFTDNLPWSVGLGIRAETDFLVLGRIQVAVSPEGVQATVGIGESF